MTTAPGGWTVAGSSDTMRGVYRPSPCQGAGRVIVPLASPAGQLVSPAGRLARPPFGRSTALPAVRYPLCRRPPHRHVLVPTGGDHRRLPPGLCHRLGLWPPQRTDGLYSPQDG